MSREFQPFVVIDGEGPTVVLVHGSWTDHSTWALIVPCLAGSARVVRYDRRGHSHSPWDGPVPRRQDEDDLARLIEALGAPVHLVANSYGASIALGLAGRRPELVASLAAHEPPLLGIAHPGTCLHREGDVILETLQRVAAQIRRGRAEQAARMFVEEVALGPGSWAMLPPEVTRTMVNNAQTLVGTVEDAGWGELAALAPPSVPLLLSDGTASPPWLRMVVEDLAASVLPHAERVTLVGAGHVPHSTNPEEYARVIRRFVASVVASSNVHPPGGGRAEDPPPREMPMVGAGH